MELNIKIHKLITIYINHIDKRKENKLYECGEEHNHCLDIIMNDYKDNPYNHCFTMVGLTKFCGF